MDGLGKVPGAKRSSPAPGHIRRVWGRQQTWLNTARQAAVDSWASATLAVQLLGRGGQQVVWGVGLGQPV